MLKATTKSIFLFFKFIFKVLFQFLTIHYSLLIKVVVWACKEMLILLLARMPLTFPFSFTIEWMKNVFNI